MVEKACRLHTLKGAAHRGMHARVDGAASVGHVDALAPEIAASLVDQRGGELHPAWTVKGSEWSRRLGARSSTHGCGWPLSGLPLTLGVPACPELPGAP